MRVWKKEGKHSGYDIYLEIGKDIDKSWWSAPGESIDHAGLKYLQDRYFKITTEKRAADFKRLYKNLWIETTGAQRKQMRHCLGLDYQDKPYRNYYYCNYNDEEWNDIVNKGLAEKREIADENGNVYYYLTRQGVEYILGKSITQLYYAKL